jgi:dolichol-phosphate mannosyltransferase
MIVPAFNEQASLAATVRTVADALAARFDDYEILIVNDGSHDGTRRVAEALAAADPRIRAVHNENNLGLGACYRKGVTLVAKEYVGWVPGKNSIPPDSLRDLFAAAGQAEVVAAYIRTDNRSLSRRVLSRAFTVLLNRLFGLRLRYFNGPNILRTDLARHVRKTTSSFAFMAEIMIRLVHAGHSYIEIGIHNRERTDGKTKAFTRQNLLGVFAIVARLFCEVRVGGAVVWLLQPLRRGLRFAHWSPIGKPERFQPDAHAMADGSQPPLRARRVNRA